MQEIIGKFYFCRISQLLFTNRYKKFFHIFGENLSTWIVCMQTRRSRYDEIVIERKQNNTFQKVHQAIISKKDSKTYPLKLTKISTIN